jgi:hypothetical protein
LILSDARPVTGRGSVGRLAESSESWRR